MNNKEEDLQPCGAIHPNHPEITCIRTGKCFIDWHLGIVKHKNGFHELVEFGLSVEDYRSRFCVYGGYRLIKVVPNNQINSVS